MAMRDTAESNIPYDKSLQQAVVTKKAKRHLNIVDAVNMSSRTPTIYILQIHYPPVLLSAEVV